MLLTSTRDRGGLLPKKLSRCRLKTAFKDRITVRNLPLARSNSSESCKIRLIPGWKEQCTEGGQEGGAPRMALHERSSGAAFWTLKTFSGQYFLSAQASGGIFDKCPMSVRLKLHLSTTGPWMGTMMRLI